MSAEESVDAPMMFKQFDACDSPPTAAADTPRRGATSDSNAAHAPQEFGSVRESERGSGSCDGMRPSFAQADARDRQSFAQARGVDKTSQGKPKQCGSGGGQLRTPRASVPSTVASAVASADTGAKSASPDCRRRSDKT